MTQHRVGILIFPDVEVLDFSGPFEVVSVARLDENRRREEPSPYEVKVVALLMFGHPVCITDGYETSFRTRHPLLRPLPGRTGPAGREAGRGPAADDGRSDPLRSVSEGRGEGAGDPFGIEINSPP